MSREASQPRATFHEELAEVDVRLSELVQFVAGAVAEATEALLREDQAAAVGIASRKHLADPLYDHVGRQVGVLMARQAPVASDLRYLLAVLRTVPELEQSAALAAQIAWRGSHSIASNLTPRARALVTRSGDVVTAMWAELCRRWDERRASAREMVEAAKEELGDLLTSLTAEVAAGGMPPSIIMDMALVGRFYERLGDHAVIIAEQLDGLTTWPPGGLADTNP